MPKPPRRPPGPSPLQRTLQNVLREVKKESENKTEALLRNFVDKGAILKKLMAFAPHPDENPELRERISVASINYKAAREALEASPHR